MASHPYIIRYQGGTIVVEGCLIRELPAAYQWDLEYLCRGHRPMPITIL